MSIRKAIAGCALAAAMAIPATALASPPDNRPPADRGGGGHQGQTQGQTQGQSQCLIVVSLLFPATC